MRARGNHVNNKSLVNECTFAAKSWKNKIYDDDHDAMSTRQYILMMFGTWRGRRALCAKWQNTTDAYLLIYKKKKKTVSTKAFILRFKFIPRLSFNSNFRTTQIWPKRQSYGWRLTIPNETDFILLLFFNLLIFNLRRQNEGSFSFINEVFDAAYTGTCTMRYVKRSMYCTTHWQCA